MFTLSELRKNPQGLAFEQELTLEQALKERNPEVLGLDKVLAQGEITYDDGLFLLTYHLTYAITLPSSRSLEPVQLDMADLVSEVFVEAKDLASKQDLVDEDLVMVIEGDSISLEESVLDNILLAIPLRVLTADEEAEQALPSGQDWALLSEEQYQQLKASEKEAANPFASLSGLFDD